MKFRPFRLIPALAVLVAQSASAADRTWDGLNGATPSTDWTIGANWTSGTGPAYGSTNTADRLIIANGTTGSGAIYDPVGAGLSGASLITTFETGRGLLIGSGFAGSLTVTSGTLKFNNATALTGNKPIMANGISAVLLINGGTMDVSGNVNDFLQILNGTSGVTSQVTVSSGSFIGNGFDLYASNTNLGNGTLNLDGGTFAVTGFKRGATTGTGTSVINLNGGLLQNRGTANNASFLNALYNTTVNVKAGGALIDSGATAGTNDITIAAVLAHDTALGATPDGGLTKSGGSVLTLSGANTYTGDTTINAGRLELKHNTAAGAGTILLAASSTELQIGGGLTVGNALTISDTGDQKTLRKFDATDSTYSGNITINESTDTNFRVQVGTTVNLMLSGIIGGSGGAGLTKINSGNLLLSGTNTYSGKTTISGGGLIASNASALGGTTDGTSVALNSALGLSGGITISNEALTLTGPGVTAAAGAFAAVQRGALQSVSGTNTYAGNITFADSGNTRIGVQNGASLILSGNITESTAGSSMIFRHSTTGVGNITLSGTGNSWTGNTDIYGGEGAVILGVDNAIPTTSLLRVGTSGVGTASTLDMNGKVQTVKGISNLSLGNGVITNNGALDSTLTLASLSADQNYEGAIKDGTTNKVALTMNSAGKTQTLSGTNTYTGATNVNAGTLSLTGTLGATAVTVASGATLVGTGTLTGTLATTGSVAPGISSTPATLATGGATWNGSAAAGAATDWKFNLGAASGSADKLAITGDFTKGTGTVFHFDFLGSAPNAWGNTYELVTWTGSNAGFAVGDFTRSNLTGSYTNGYFTLNSNSLLFTAIPEPTTALAGLLLGAGLLRRRRA